MPANAGIDAIATGPLKPSGLPAGYSPQTYIALFASDPATAVAIATPRVVGADPRRTLLDHNRYISEHFTTTGTPVGHGFTSANRSADIGYYVVDPAPAVRLIALDTLNRGGYNDGSIDQAQLDWLTARLTECSSRFVDAGGGWAATHNPDRLVMVLSHHTINTMENPTVDPANPGPRIMGDQVLALLQRFPNVVAWVNGHTHVNSVTPRPGLAGMTAGFWEINTAAHIDWPAQCRLVELVDNRDGTLSIFGTLVDHAGGLAPVAGAAGVLDLAATARALAANDNQKGARAYPVAAGGAEDRNVELLLPAPFSIDAALAGSSAQGGAAGANGSAALTAEPNTAAAGAPAAGTTAALVLAAAAVVARRRRDPLED
ncbi:MAG: hypothetical protein E6J20_20745 [Chloroflexi bacterium]|nr:MAG: hypothetical protein E6J20_20745 [Chloroflexota bacterium]